MGLVHPACRAAWRTSIVAKRQMMLVPARIVVWGSIVNEEYYTCVKRISVQGVERRLVITQTRG